MTDSSIANPERSLFLLGNSICLLRDMSSPARRRRQAVKQSSSQEWATAALRLPGTVRGRGAGKVDPPIVLGQDHFESLASVRPPFVLRQDHFDPPSRVRPPFVLGQDHFAPRRASARHLFSVRITSTLRRASRPPLPRFPRTHPFTAPFVTPEKIKRCRNKYSTTVGIMMSRMMAQM
ncbi:hypothetical protein COHCIP112018_02092 [Cohnella sp. JJ-181]|nr:hypothetical protein COHCIP112018_02092 [Cohnella sp. JJ-181]